MILANLLELGVSHVQAITIKMTQTQVDIPHGSTWGTWNGGFHQGKYLEKVWKAAPGGRSRANKSLTDINKHFYTKKLEMQVVVKIEQKHIWDILGLY